MYYLACLAGQLRPAPVELPQVRKKARVGSRSGVTRWFAFFEVRKRMKIFLDSASLEEIRCLSEDELIDGVTTNPSLIAKQGLVEKDRLYAHYSQICDLAPDNVSLELLSENQEEMLAEAQELASLSPKAVVKVPMGTLGLQVIRRLSAQGIRTNCTLIFSPLQALLAAKAGATFVSPFVGRIDDLHVDGTKLISHIKQIFTNYNFSTQILLASVRNMQHVLSAALIGADALTATYATLLKIPKHMLTTLGAQQFMDDYQQAHAHALRTQNKE